MNINNEASNTRAMQLHTLSKLVTEKRVGNDILEISLESNIDMNESLLLNCQGQLADIVDTLETKKSIIFSDVDEQIIIKLSFIEPVSITKFGILAVATDKQDQKLELSEPKLVKLYVNSPLIDFNEIEDLTPCYSRNFSLEDLKEFSIFNLPGSKFHRVKHITIFIQENQENK